MAAEKVYLDGTREQDLRASLGAHIADSVGGICHIQEHDRVLVDLNGGPKMWVARNHRDTQRARLSLAWPADHQRRIWSEPGLDITVMLSMDVERILKAIQEKLFDKAIPIWWEKSKAVAEYNAQQLYVENTAHRLATMAGAQVQGPGLKDHFYHQNTRWHVATGDEGPFVIIENLNLTTSQAERLIAIFAVDSAKDSHYT